MGLNKQNNSLYLKLIRGRLKTRKLPYIYI